MGNHKFTVIIACFNEEANIEHCLKSVLAACPDAEILVVHGGSDQTGAITLRMAGEFPQIRLVKNENDRGKGHAIRTGIAAASHDVMAQFDADNQFFAEDLPALVAPIFRDEADVTLGSRFMGSSDRTAYKPSFFRDIGNRSLSLYVTLLTGRPVTDVTAGVKAWTRKSIEAINLKDDRYSYEAEIVVRAAVLKQRVKEVPVRYASRIAGNSMHSNNLAVIRAGLTIMAHCLRFRFR
jgi:glycosyltransferase involved in cell wall biosynthesis